MALLREIASSYARQQEAPKDYQSKDKRDDYRPSQLRTMLLMSLGTRGIVDECAAELVGVVRSIGCRCFTLLTLHLIDQFLQTVARFIRIDAYPAEAAWLPRTEQIHFIGLVGLMGHLELQEFRELREPLEYLEFLEHLKLPGSFLQCPSFS